MIIKTRNPPIKVRFPLWKYLNQRLFQKGSIINPIKFWHQYLLDLLESSWELDSRAFLEKCWHS
ncbi:MAG: hypothetical protein KME29_34265 [Calothrix sp. FI2-JRJ7]|jgi:hypothetical protein|nr:hypothetical protein [Calothrix sp. FI2-JRJ7]